MVRQSLGCIGTGTGIGNGTGLLRAVQPAPRLLAGVLLLLACVASPGRSVAGIAFIAAVPLAMTLLSGVRRGLLRRVLGFGLLLYIPLLAILLGASALTGSPPLGHALGTAGIIAVKAMATLAISIAVVATLENTQLHDALGRLPLPGWTRLLLLQIVHQAGNMLDETARIRQALAVRGAGGSGRSAWRVAAALPAVWLERIAARAARTTAAMEVRGYSLYSPEPFPGPAQWRFPDTAALGGATLALLLALALHVI